MTLFQEPQVRRAVFCTFTFLVVEHMEIIVGFYPQKVSTDSIATLLLFNSNGMPCRSSPL